VVAQVNMSSGGDGFLVITFEQHFDVKFALWVVEVADGTQEVTDDLRFVVRGHQDGKDREELLGVTESLLVGDVLDAVGSEGAYEEQHPIDDHGGIHRGGQGHGCDPHRDGKQKEESQEDDDADPQTPNLSSGQGGGGREVGALSAELVDAGLEARLGVRWIEFDDVHKWILGAPAQSGPR
jgi:hypothetical protein